MSGKGASGPGVPSARTHHRARSTPLAAPTNFAPQCALSTLTMPDLTAVTLTWTGGKDKARKPQRKERQGHNQGVHSVERRERASPLWSCTRTEFLGGAHTRGDDPGEHHDK